MTTFQIISASATIVLGCLSIIWFFVRRFINSTDKQIETLDIIQDRLHEHDTRITRLEVLKEVG